MLKARLERARAPACPERSASAEEGPVLPADKGEGAPAERCPQQLPATAVRLTKDARRTRTATRTHMVFVLRRPLGEDDTFRLVFL